MIEPLTSLSLAAYSNKGAYALLLGSGVSRPSGIPTGWEVVVDLIRKVAALEGFDCEPDPAEWFREKYQCEPDYSQLLDRIANTSTERQQLLRRYFEPTDNDREHGLKLPSAAHRAIARLVASGHVRVILTTNFDRLTEKALEDVGISPTVISTADQIVGSLPLVHSRATIFKLHGDYLDTRIRNTESELASYEQAFDSLLDRILDEYGLIVSGWSGDWDIALRAAIERCPNRRFTTFWATRSPLSEKASALAQHRRAQIVHCEGADQLFIAIEEKIRALEDLTAPHPLSSKVAVATVKRYIVDPSARIRLHDLFHDETERLFVDLKGTKFDFVSSAPIGSEIKRRIEAYHAHADIVVSMLITAAYWGGDAVVSRLVATIQRLADLIENQGGYVHLINLRKYPPLLVLYAVGVAAVASGNFKLLAAILTQPKAMDLRDGRIKEICAVVYPIAAVEIDNARMLPGLESRKVPVSDILHDALRIYFVTTLPRDCEFDEYFDRFEYILGWVHADLVRREPDRGQWWGPVGRFKWSQSYISEDKQISGTIDREIRLLGEDWPLVKAGMFGSELSRATTAKSKYDSFLATIP